MLEFKFLCYVIRSDANLKQFFKFFAKINKNEDPEVNLIKR